MWAHMYIVKRVYHELDWDTSLVTANDIETFVHSSARDTGATTRKLATNLNYLYRVGSTERISVYQDRAMVGGCFFSLRWTGLSKIDLLDGRITHPAEYTGLLIEEDFLS